MIRISTLAFIIFSVSCVYNTVATVKDLGDGFYYIGAASESTIEFSETPLTRRNSSSKSSRTIVPFEVLQLNYNSKFIIAKSRDRFTGNLDYWIVLKTNSTDCFRTSDSTLFNENLIKNNVDLTLEKRY